MKDHAPILKLFDEGKHAPEIAALLPDVSLGTIYNVLRKNRPDRERKPRRRTSEKRAFVLGLHAQGIKPDRIAFLAQCSPAYVYRIISE